MTDYDWAGGHADLDDWWVRTHADLVTRAGVDGFRLDVAIQRPDLWLRIKREAGRAGHPIVVSLEPDRDCGGSPDASRPLTVTDLRGAGAARGEGDVLTFPVPRDRVRGGGLAVHRVEWR